MLVVLRGSHTGIDELGEVGGTHDPLAPLGIESGGRLRGNRVLKGAALPLEGCDFLANGDEHVAIARELRPVAGGRAAYCRSPDRTLPDLGPVPRGRARS